MVTIPKAGTNYLNLIISNLLDIQVLHPIGPLYSKAQYDRLKENSDVVVVWHSEPLVLDLIPKRVPVLFLVRDPRDVALSAVDFIDKGHYWEGIDCCSWNRLTRKERIEVVIDKVFNERGFSVSNFFETAIQLIIANDCCILNYEELSPECNSDECLAEVVKRIGRFFNQEVSCAQAKEVIAKSFKNSSCWSLNKAKVFRFLEEEKEVIETLEVKLGKYIDCFNYVRSMPNVIQESVLGYTAPAYNGFVVE